MARVCSRSEAKKLIDDFRRLDGLLADGEDIRRVCRDEIVDAADAYLDAEVRKLLAEVPVEELNRSKRGFRVKTLRDAGYETLTDLDKADLQALIDINGISEEGAKAIKAAVADTADTVRQGVRIRLSLDDRSAAAARLVGALYRYQACAQPSADCGKLRSTKITAAIADLQPAAALFPWFFTSRQRREKAGAAYAHLTGLIESGYITACQQVFASLQTIRECPEDAVWADFSENSVRYFTALETVYPGALGAGDRVYGLPEELAAAIAEEPYLPEGLNCTLRRYQEWGVKYILHQERVLLGDEMGLGKTVQAIAAMVSLRNSGGRHFMVVCPASVLTNWCREIQKMSDLPVFKVHGNERGAAFDAWEAQGGVAVTTYETTGILYLPDDFRVSLLVVDEAHYIKNPAARRTGYVKDLATHADRLLFMTGTALENRVDEMVSLIRVLQPRVAAALNGMEALAAAPQFRDKVAPVYYRRKREDVLTELPELIESREWCTLLPEEEQIYERAVLAGDFIAARRVSWNIEDLSNSSKARRLLEIAALAEDDSRKVLVFSFFLDTLRRVRELLGDRCMEPINGSVPPQRRQEIIDRFNAAPAGSVLTAQIQSGGTGLNIQSASVVVLCEPQFKPSIEQQAIARAYRMGQARNVLVYRLLCDDTLEERIMDLLEEKQAIFDAFADKSTAAGESRELDEKIFGALLKEEQDRISGKTNAAEAAPS